MNTVTNDVAVLFFSLQWNSEIYAYVDACMPDKLRWKRLIISNPKGSYIYLKYLQEAHDKSRHNQPKWRRRESRQIRHYRTAEQWCTYYLLTAPRVAQKAPEVRTDHHAQKTNRAQQSLLRRWHRHVTFHLSHHKTDAHTLHWHDQCAHSTDHDQEYIEFTECCCNRSTSFGKYGLILQNWDGNTYEFDELHCPVFHLQFEVEKTHCWSSEFEIAQHTLPFVVGSAEFKVAPIFVIFLVNSPTFYICIDSNLLKNWLLNRWFDQLLWQKRILTEFHDFDANFAIKRLGWMSYETMKLSVGISWEMRITILIQRLSVKSDNNPLITKLSLIPLPLCANCILCISFVPILLVSNNIMYINSCNIS